MPVLERYPDLAEKPKSFDVLASVDLYRFDLQTVGYIRPETKQRVYDEEMVLIAEGINQPLATEFRFQNLSGQLVYFDSGVWRPYLATLIKGCQTAEREALQDARKFFLAERAVEDLKVGYKLLELQPGQKLNWYSPFPDRQRNLYGQEFIGELGFQPKRRMGFLYQAEKHPDGSLSLRTQSVDNSDEQAFAAALAKGADSTATLDDLRDAYDGVLEQRYGQTFFAGRARGDEPPEENAWLTVSRHKDLIEDFYFKKIEDLAGLDEIPRSMLERAKKRLTYGVWAALKQRLDKGSLNLSSPRRLGGSIQQEVNAAYSSLAAKGQVLFGCGGSISGEVALLKASAYDVHKAIFNKQRMTCPFCGDKDQYGDPCSPNQHCSACQATVEKGQVKSKGHGRHQAKDRDQAGEDGFFEILARGSAKIKLAIKLSRFLRRQKELLEKSSQMDMAVVKHHQNWLKKEEKELTESGFNFGWGASQLRV